MMPPVVSKSSRHSKITGDFAEYLVLYWLSKHGVECARVDHVGLDLIARQDGTPLPIGISVKSRSRNPGTEGSYLSIPNDNFQKLKVACEAFGCEPYFAIIIDENDCIDAYLLSSERLQEIHPQKHSVSSWKMGSKWRDLYQNDSQIIKFSFLTRTDQWF